MLRQGIASVSGSLRIALSATLATDTAMSILPAASTLSHLRYQTTMSPYSSPSSFKPQPKLLCNLSHPFSSRLIPTASTVLLHPVSFRHSSTAPGTTTPPTANPFDGKDVDVLNHSYKAEFLEAIKPTHLPPKKLYQKLGFSTVQLARGFFDRISGYGADMTEAKWMQRFIFLETVAGVPGMCAGMLRHLKSLRSMERDNGWISHLLDEAENERMHLLTFMTMRQPGPLFRSLVILAQGIFFNAYFVAYLVSPRTCHAFVGYLEEEAVKTYTHALEDIENGCLKHWQTKEVPEIAMHYWKMKEGSTLKDLIMAVRADEAGHSHVNHRLSNISQDAVNPFVRDSTMHG